MAKANNYGIQNLKTGITVFAGIFKTSFNIDLNKDGKIDGSERIAYLGNVLPQTFPFFGIFTELGNEVKDKITEEEWDELTDFIVATDFLPDDRDEAEDYLRLVILWINYNRRFVVKSIAFFSKEEKAELMPEIVRTVSKVA